MSLAINEQGHIALANQLDAAGRHGEALGVLDDAAAKGGVHARGMLAARLLLGDRAPARPEQGARLMTEAAAGGNAAAAAIVAVLYGLGLHRQKDWESALDYLQRAAELGLVNARGALGALAADAALGARAMMAEPPAGLWRRLRANVDVAALIAPPPGRNLHDEPLIRAYAGFASPLMCAWLVNRARGRLSRAQVYNAVSQAVETSGTRTNTAATFGLLDVDLAQIALQARIAAAVGAPSSHLESPAVLHYAVGEQIVEHFDFVDPALPDHDEQVARDGQRVVTFLVYLNDAYEGGETEFPRLGVSHKGRAGEGVFFVNATPDGKADVRTVHAGRPPRAGEKWIVSQFIRSRPSLPGAPNSETFAHPTPA
jgi:hypothetical protein